MAEYQLLLPKMGESVAEATIIKWVKNPGDLIQIDETVLEIATDKVDSDVPSPVAGKLIKQLFKDDEVVQVGDVIAIIETEGSSNTESKTSTPEIENVEVPYIKQEIEELSEAVEAKLSTTRFYSPLVKSIANEEGISLSELDMLKGTGAENRITKQDLLDYIENKKSGSIPTISDHSEIGKQESVKETHTSQAVIEPISIPKAETVVKSDVDEIIEIDRMGKLIADHMVMSKHTSAHVTSFVEADVTNMVKWRDRVKNAFEKREGEKITFTPIFIEAVAKAIKDMPMINVSVNGTQIIKRHNINIGMAAALPSGNLIVPVIKNADQLNLVGLTKSVNDLANRARLSKLKPDETQGGTFTITNVGSFGNVMGTPIINQPQVAILAVGAIKKKPAVLETEFGDVIAVRHMMFLSLSYDHRVVNGALGGSFVRRVADYLEAWDIKREI